MTVVVRTYLGDGRYFLDDPAHELDGLRSRAPGHDLVGDHGGSPASMLRDVLGSHHVAPCGALDVIIAAPKPVSVLLATLPAVVGRRVVDLHERAVNAAFGYLCREGVVRQGNGQPRAIGFTHGVNRMLDPHLHTHAVLSLHDDRGAPVSPWAVRLHAAAADALYLATLRAGLPGAASRASWRSASGRFCVEGVDVGLVAATSVPRDRRGQVERSGAKSYPTRAAVCRRWDHVVSSNEPLGVLCDRSDGPSGMIDEYAFARALGDGLVSRRTVVAAWADACTHGAGASDVLRCVELVVPSNGGAGRLVAAVVRDDLAVRVLGPRPLGLADLAGWQAGRAALSRHLASGHKVTDVLDDRRASSRERLALAKLDVELHALPGHLVRGRPRATALPRKLGLTRRGTELGNARPGALA